MATGTDRLLSKGINSNYKTLRNGDEDEQRESQTELIGPSTSGFIDFWIRLWSCLVSMTAFAILVTFILAYCKDTGFDNDEMAYKIAPLGGCSINITNSDALMFEDLVVERNFDVLYVKLDTSKAVNSTNDTEIYRPNEWIWTHGDSAILVWPESYELWSFGILDLHTKTNVTIHLELYPQGCSFTWGESTTTINVGRALLNFIRSTNMFEKKNLKHSKWCYTVRLRNVTGNPVLEQDFSYFVQDLGYKCCQFHHNKSGDLVSSCDKEVVVERLWTNIPFIFAFVSLFISSNLMVFIYQFRSFKSHVYWIHNTEQSNHDYASTADQWMYTDYKSPITFLSFLRSFTHMYNGCTTKTTTMETDEPVSPSCCCNTYCPHGLKRFFKYVFLSISLVALSLSVIFLSLIMYTVDETSYHLLQQEIKSDVPIGFLSLLFPFEENHENFMFHIKGPYVFISVYCFLAFCYLLVFEYFKPAKCSREYSTGNFALNLDLVEKYGRIKCTVNDKYGIFETIHANSRAIFRGGFWWDLFNRLVLGEGVLCLSKCSGKCTQLLLNFMKLPILLFSILLSVIVHLVPFLFASLLILTDCIRKTRTKMCFDPICIVILSAVHLCLVFSFTIIFFGSAEFIFLMFSFCVLSIVLFPGAASGIFIFVLVGVYYIVERFRSIAKKYATYRDLTISVSQALCDKCKGAETNLSEDKKRLLIAGVMIRAVKYIAFVADPQSQISGEDKIRSERVKQSSFHCHMNEKTLKVIGDVDTFTLEFISINGIPVKVDRNVKQDGHNKLFRLESERSQMKLVLLNVRNSGSKTETVTDIGFCPEDDICYVTYRNGLPGIPWTLMDTIVKEYVPISAERLQAFMWTIVVSCVIAWLSIIIKRFDQWEQMSTIVNALMVVLLVKLSQVVQMFSVDVGDEQKKNILKAQLIRTVQEYWAKQEYAQYLRKDDEMPSCSGELRETSVV